MKNKINDKDILRILTSMKNAENNYPQDMIASRRDAFTKQAAAMTILMKAGGSGAASTGAGQAASTATSSGTTGIGGISMGTILETALVIAIVAEAGIAAYAYREKIVEFINSTFRASVDQVENPPNDSSPNPILSNKSTPEFLEESPTITVTVTETPTPTDIIIPASADNNQNNYNNGDIGNSQVTSTPAPDGGNNGLHLGQTKQPTKQPKNNNETNEKNKKK